MKKIALFLVLTVILIGCDKTVKSSELKRIDNIRYLENELAPYTGFAVEYYKSGKLFYKSHFKNGKEDRYFSLYSSDAASTISCAHFSIPRLPLLRAKS